MILFDRLNNKRIILGSKSPRRKYLLEELGIQFEVRTKNVNEDFSNNLKAQEIPLYLSEKKSKAFENELQDNEIVITADTVVWINEKALNKPESRENAIEMLNLLSGKQHQVFTGVCIRSKSNSLSFYVETKVKFKTLSSEEISYYVDKYQPFDKAGSYGVQEFLGYIAIESIEGSYYNVMGLPIKELYEALEKFV